MKAYTIVIKDNDISEDCAKKLIQSSQSVDNEFEIEKFDAITPKNVKQKMSEEGVTWNYPWQGNRLDLATGLKLSAYETADPNKRMACFLSHYTLWNKCVQLDEPIIVLEHDAVFINKVDVDLIHMSKYDIIALNDPRGATRKSKLYYDMVKQSTLPIVGVPKIDDDQIPQGLPGNSAYYIKPSGAKRMIYLTREYGAWPNDALMCKQLLPKKLGIVREFCTKVQGTRSTTTL